MDFSIVYITCSHLDTAQSIGRQLVEERLTACVNIIGPILSIYEDASLVEKQEYILLAKTLSDRVENLIRRVLELHEYNTPAILAWSVDGDEHFLDWMKRYLTQR
ncbi:MAG: divalent-cation tolerance protein CutA [Holosporales bacterium]|jgi:periplasmic divalent cation tolerance protein|nr:divalent-cation tolerance protein CutA [Holosporales bacterium]